MIAWPWLIAAFVAGGITGMLVTALCAAARIADAIAEIEDRRNPE